MSSCKRIWEGTVGVTIKPQQQRNGDCFWTFSFVRAYKRKKHSPWEYAQHFGQRDAERLGVLMSKAFQFMEQTDAATFLAAAMTDNAASGSPAIEQAEATPLAKAA